MSMISARVNEKEKEFITRYAKTKNISISDLIRSAVLEEIEDSIDIQLLEQAIEEREKDKSKSYTFEEAADKLGFNIDEI